MLYPPTHSEFQTPLPRIPEVFSTPSEFLIQSTNPPPEIFFRPLKNMRCILNTVAGYPAAGNDTQNARYPAAGNDTQNASKMLDTWQPGKIQKFEKMFDTCDWE